MNKRQNFTGIKAEVLINPNETVWVQMLTLVLYAIHHVLLSSLYHALSFSLNLLVQIIMHTRIEKFFCVCVLSLIKFWSVSYSLLDLSEIHMAFRNLNPIICGQVISFSFHILSETYP